MHSKQLQNSNRTSRTGSNCCCISNKYVAIGSGHTALAANGNKTKENDGISIPTKTQQKQECETAGATSPVTASCTAVNTNTITQSGGVLSEEK